MITPDTVARWMLGRLEASGGSPYQEEAADATQERFGSEFTYEDANGNLAIERSVLQAFRKLTEDRVVWCRPERYWRWREEHDPPGRLVDY